MSKSFAHTLGHAVGTAGAYVWEGSRLASTQFAAGATEGYAAKAAELRAKRVALAAGQALPAPEAAVTAAKARVVKVKA